MTKISKFLLVLAIISLIVFLLIRFLFYILTPVYYTPLLITVLCLIGTLVLDFQFYKEFLFLKTTRYGFNMGTVILLCLVLMVSVNYITFKMGKRWNLQWDLTEEKLFTLSDQTTEVLSHLEGPLIFKGFFVQGNQNHDMQKNRFRDILRRYRQASSNVEESYINPHLEPAQAQEYNIDETGGLVVEYQGQRTKINAPLEEDITNAIIKVTRRQQKNLYFLKNHGEIDLNTSEERGGSSLRQELTSASYNVHALDALSHQGKIPENADVLFILGPKTPFLDFEVQMIEEYLKQGGRLLLALDPGFEHNFESLLTQMGVKFRGDYVIDQTSVLLREVPLTALGVSYSTISPITEKFPSAMTLFFMSSGWDRLDTTSESMKQEDIVKTSGVSVATEKLEREATVTAKGPFTLVKSIKGSFAEEDNVASTTDDAEGKNPSEEENTKADITEDEESNEFHAVLYGDSDIFTNSRIFQQLNRDLVLNTVAALAADADLISIRPKSPNQTDFKGIGRTAYRIFFISAIVIPLLCFILGIILYYRRKNA